jgi:DNA-directed RNA polymerase specialized sigma24 family protein
MAKKRKKKMKSKIIKSVKKKRSTNYIDNTKMFNEMCEYLKQVKQYQKVIKNIKFGDAEPSKPKVSEYIGTCIMMIAQRLATKPNFANYTHREEMVSDGIENCLTYIDNFDPDKSKNPFAYFTQIIYYAFIRRIQREKKQTFIKMKLVEKMDSKGHIRRMLNDENNPERESRSANAYADFFNLSDTDVTFFEKKTEQKLSKKKARKTRKSHLDDFFA